MNSIIAQLDDVHLIYHEPRGETEAVGGISLSVHKGEFVSIVGPSGCGKTSLLSILRAYCSQAPARRRFSAHRPIRVQTARATCFSAIIF